MCPDIPGAERLDAFLIRGLIKSSSIRFRVRVGSGSGSSVNCGSTMGGSWGKKRQERIFDTSLCVWARPSVPCSDGTFESLRPCRHFATSHNWASLM